LQRKNENKTKKPFLKNHHEGFIRVPEEPEERKKSPSFTICGIEKKTYKTLFL